MKTNQPSFRERVAALSASQRSALAREIDARATTRAALASSPKRLVVYWQAKRETGARGATEDELRTFLADRLPGYMLPSAYCELSEIPKTPAGKIDRRRLPAPDDARSRSGPDEASADRSPGARDGTPRNETERILCGVWKEVLGLDYVSIDDDFFEVGGDSLLSIRVLSRARRQGVEIDPELFFANSTIARLTDNLDPNASVAAEAAAKSSSADSVPEPVAGATESSSLDTGLSGLDAADLESVGAMLAELDDD